MGQYKCWNSGDMDAAIAADRGIRNPYSRHGDSFDYGGLHTVSYVCLFGLQLRPEFEHSHRNSGIERLHGGNQLHGEIPYQRQRDSDRRREFYLLADQLAHK